jgi:hypothetical protein
MDQSRGVGSKFRRVLPFGLAALGVYAVVAYGSAMFSSPKSQLVAQNSALPAQQAVTAAQQLPSSLPAQVPNQISQVAQPATSLPAVSKAQSVAHDTLPSNASSPVDNLQTAAQPAASQSSSNSSQSATGGLPAVGGLSNVPSTLLQNIPLSQVGGLPVTSPNSVSGATGALKGLPVSTDHLAGLGGVTLPNMSGSLPGGLALPQGLLP